MPNKIFKFGQKGSTLISVAFAGALLAVAAVGLTGTISTLGASTKVSADLSEAEAHAVELLEYFLSMKADRLREVLGTNPINSLKFKAYPLCAPINLAVRTSKGDAILNRDPLADLPSTTSLIGASRYYRVEVVDLADPANITSRRDLCDSDPKRLDLSATERFLITVGVTWRKGGTDEIASAAISGVLSDVAGPPP